MNFVLKWFQVSLIKIRALLAVTLVLPVLAGAGCADDLTVFAAASLKESLQEVGRVFEVETGHRVVFSFAGSSLLARQIVLGAPADLFLSANGVWMDYVAEKNGLRAGFRQDLLENRLVLVAPARKQAQAQELTPALLQSHLTDGRFAMALVEAVPAGIYGKSALENLGLWNGVKTRVAQSDNVRAALALVATGEAPLGLVYYSDALAEPRVSVLANIPQQSHPAIRYPVAVLSSATPIAEDFFLFLKGEGAKAIFAKAGFLPIEE